MARSRKVTLGCTAAGTVALIALVACEAAPPEEKHEDPGQVEQAQACSIGGPGPTPNTCCDGSTPSVDRCSWPDLSPNDVDFHSSVSDDMDWGLVDVAISGTMYSHRHEHDQECSDTVNSYDVKQAEIEVTIKNPFDNDYCPKLARQMMTWAYGAISPQLVGWGFYGSLKSNDKLASDAESTPQACCSATTGTCGNPSDSKTEKDDELEAIAQLEKHLGQGGADLIIGARYTRLTADKDTASYSYDADGTETYGEDDSEDVAVNKLGLNATAVLNMGPVCLSATFGFNVCQKSSSETKNHFAPPPATSETEQGPGGYGVEGFINLNVNGVRCGHSGVYPNACHADGDQVCCGLGWFAKCFPANTTWNNGGNCGA